MEIYLILIYIIKLSIESKMYLTMNLIEVDDCLVKVYKEEDSPFFEFKNEINKTTCKIGTYDYPNPLINKTIYNFGDIIYFNISDAGQNYGFLKIDVIINEYIIRNKHQKFWTCNNCKYDDNNYKYNKESDRFEFYEGKSKEYEIFFNFFFQINDLNDLNYVGNEVNSSFYELKSQNEKIDKSFDYIDKEIELINLISTHNFDIKNNPKNISINYENYYFKIYFNGDSFNGKLKSLNLTDSDIELNNGSNFKNTNSSGLRYILSYREKIEKKANLFFEIEGFNSPLNTSLSKPIAKKVKYYFNISILPDPSVCFNEIYYYYFYYDISKGKYYECLNLEKDEIINNLTKIINDIEIDKYYEIKAKDIIINIYPLNSTLLSLLTNTNFELCESVLKIYNNISESSVITIVQMENKNQDYLLNKKGYKVYNNKEQLNLSICNNKDIDIKISESKEFRTFFEISDIYLFDNITKIFYASTNKTKEEIIKNITKLIENIKIDQKYEIKGDDYNIKISPTNATYLSISTHVNFKKCENILRTHYNISSSRYITFFQLEINNTNSKILVNKVEYQAYDDNKKLLNLSLCDENIKIIHSLKSISIFDFLSAYSFKDLGIDIFNINDSFFTDVCHSYSDEKNDLTLKDRIKDIFQNYSLCEDECSYDEINLENKTITCDCKVKKYLSLEDITLNFFQYNEKSSNFKIIKCYNLVFSLKGKLKNIGFWIFLFLVTAHIPLLILFFYGGIKPIKEYIIKEMTKNGYIKKIKKNHIIGKNKNTNENTKKSKIKKTNKKKEQFSPPKSIKIGKSMKKKIIKSDKKLNNKIFKIKAKNPINKTLTKNKKINKCNITQNISNSNYIINILPTKEDKKNKNLKKTENNILNFNIININLNNGRNYYPKDSNQILYNYTFEEAIKYDLRSVCLIYYIFLLSKQAIFHAFLFKSPLEIIYLRLCLLIFIYSSDLALNAFFYLDDKISEKYHYTKGLFLFAFSNNITVILLSTLVGFLFMTLFTNLSNLTLEIKNIFRKEEEKLIKNKKYFVNDKRKKEILNEIEKILKKFKIKIIILIIIEFSLMLFFWYYVTAFCHVYNATQYSWLFDSFLSILSRTVIDFLIPLGLAKLYRIAVESNIHCLYKVILFLYSFA